MELWQLGASWVCCTGVPPVTTGLFPTTPSPFPSGALYSENLARTPTRCLSAGSLNMLSGLGLVKVKGGKATLALLVTTLLLYLARSLFSDDFWRARRLRSCICLYRFAYTPKQTTTTNTSSGKKYTGFPTCLTNPTIPKCVGVNSFHACLSLGLLRWNVVNSEEQHVDVCVHVE